MRAGMKCGLDAAARGDAARARHVRGVRRRPTSPLRRSGGRSRTSRGRARRRSRAPRPPPAGKALAEQVHPAFAALKRFLESEYLPAAATSSAPRRCPRGRAYYAHSCGRRPPPSSTPTRSTTSASREVARIRAEMDKVDRRHRLQGHVRRVPRVPPQGQAVLLHQARGPAARLPRHRQARRRRAAEALRRAAAHALRHPRDGGVRGRQLRPLLGRRDRRQPRRASSRPT